MSASLTAPGPSSPLKPWLAWLAQRGEEETVGLADYLVGRLPSLRDDSDELRAALASHLPNMYELADGSAGAAPRLELPLPVQRWLGAQRRRGAALELLCRSFDLGHQEYWRKFATWLRDEADVSPAEQAATLEQGSLRILGYLGAVTQAVMAAYQRDAFHDEQARRLAIVTDVLGGTLDEFAASDLLGYRFSAPQIAFVVTGRGDAAHEQVTGFVRRLVRETRPWQHLAVPLGTTAARGWMSTDDPDWRTRFTAVVPPAGMTLAAAGPHHGLAGFRTAGHEAMAARRVAELTRSDVPVLYEDVTVAALCSRDAELALHFVHGLLGKLDAAGDSSEKLLETLMTYLKSSGSPTRAARVLGVHTNTVVKRLERLERLLGMPIDGGNLELRIAVELAPLVMPPAPPG